MNIHMNLGKDSYDIVVERGILKRASEEINLQRKVFIVTDSGVPKEYAKEILNQCKEGYVFTIPQGEESKNLKTFETLLREMLSYGFSRSDCVVAVGGGVVGDLSGFVASAYMRGIEFYNIPTTVLSQIDSSIGGKVAVDLDGYKNIIGAFYQPSKVLIDPDVLKTLPSRQISNGLSEAVKMAITSDEELFEIFEKNEPMDSIDEIIIKSLNIKKSVVEQDEKEMGLRKILNFGHTIGHAIEKETGFSSFYHGECVALGMIPMCSDSLKARLIPVLEKLSLPTKADINIDSVSKAISHDKKVKDGKVSAVFSDRLGSFEIKSIECDSLKDRIALIAKGGNSR